MKYLKLFENFNKSQIDDICEYYGITNYSINPDGSIDVDGYVDLSDYNLTELPLKFNKVSGRFDCTNCALTTLIGCPNYVGDGFYSRRNKLTNLIGGPKEVVGIFDMEGNELTSLDGYPKIIGGDFFPHENPITHWVIRLFDYNVKIYLDYQETYNFLRKDCKIVKHLLEEVIKDYNEYYDKQVELPEKIEGYTYEN